MFMKRVYSFIVVKGILLDMYNNDVCVSRGINIQQKGGWKYN
jgi:hypothetical protein